VVFWPVGHRQRRDQLFDAGKRGVGLGWRTESRPCAAFLGDGLDERAPVPGREVLGGLGDIDGSLVVPCGEDLPCLGFQAPRRDFGVAGLASQLPGCPQVGDSGVIVVHVDQAGGGQQGQPSACDEQPAVLSERGAGVQQMADIPQVSPYPDEQVGGRRAGVGRGEIVNGQLKLLKDAVPYVAGLRAPGELQRGNLVVSGSEVRHGYAVPALCGSERGERAVSTEHLVKVSGQFRGWPCFPAAQVRDVAGIAGHAARHLTHPKTARFHQARQLPAESTHVTCNPIPRAFAPRCLFGPVCHTGNDGGPGSRLWDRRAASITTRHRLSSRPGGSFLPRSAVALPGTRG
jgi:hypothetical protein